MTFDGANTNIVHGKDKSIYSVQQFQVYTCEW